MGHAWKSRELDVYGSEMVTSSGMSSSLGLYSGSGGNGRLVGGGATG